MMNCSSCCVSDKVVIRYWSMQLKIASQALLLALVVMCSGRSHGDQATRFAATETADLYALLPATASGNGKSTAAMVMQFREKLTRVSSVLIIYELDCRNKLIRMLRSRNFGGPMATGELIGEMTPQMLGPEAMVLQPTTEPDLQRFMALVCNGRVKS